MAGSQWDILMESVVGGIVLSAECPSVIDEVSRCFQFGPWASIFASEANFSDQLKARLRAEVTSVSCDSVFALFPAICCVEKF
jgi:hypothetical protein